MKKLFYTLMAVVMVSALGATTSHAALIAGVDFDDGSGTYDRTPDDLNLADGISVSVWTVADLGIRTLPDGGAQTGRASVPVGKTNGSPGTSTPLVGDAAPTGFSGFFTLTIPSSLVLDLTNVTFDFSGATTSPQVRWLAFKTSLDANLTFAQDADTVVRPNFINADVDLSGALYQGLTGTTVDFAWYSGGAGSGDVDIDTIVINGTVSAIPEPSSMLLLGLGFAGMFGVSRRRKK